MRDLEVKEKDLNKLKVKSDGLLGNNHPASDKIDVRCSGFIIILISNSALFCSFVLRSPFALAGLHGHLTDPVELASADH